MRQLESLIDAGAVSAPDGEVAAHTVLYSLPLLTQLYARDTARHGEPGGRPGLSLVPAPAAPDAEAGPDAAPDTCAELLAYRS
ncbi:hypothetical protein [Streptacidiphilus sp. PB12-B1b]|uniref:hypothetical protein n=1 Tax=Streptacidiphilus sp. PB12-B1b TaxID=2705012 RepID=UPI001CDBE400|nr:hypothetical protein [Streptacidiphilus sp. PB12-B1b]